MGCIIVEHARARRGKFFCQLTHFVAVTIQAGQGSVDNHPGSLAGSERFPALGCQRANRFAYSGEWFPIIPLISMR